MTTVATWLRKQQAGVVALVVMAALFVIGSPSFASDETKAELSASYAFKPLSIAMPAGFPQQTMRKVNQRYKHIDAWISSVGAGIAMNDLDMDGLSNDLCVTDTRIDQVVVTPTPGERSGRYQPFALTPGSLPVNDAIAPMGCIAGDFNEDGRNDVLVYYWGRTPIVHLAKPGATTLGADAYVPTELVPNKGGSVYTGAQWNTNTASTADFDGDGHLDIFIGNYFAHGPVLNDRVNGGVEMNDSMSHAANGGENYFFRFTGTAPAASGSPAAPSFECLDKLLATNVSKGWELGASTADLDGDLLPELFLNNDFGPDRLLHNTSTPGKISFRLVDGDTSPWVPKSKTIGRDSFKGMGSDFGDLDGDGLWDSFVSNTTTSFGIQESNHAFYNTAKDKADVRAQLADGVAPFEDRSAQDRTAWTGWGWDVKIDDFDNSGVPAIVQATGFVKGEVNRWPQLQELATANDGVLRNPHSWPAVGPEADIAGSQTLAFFVKEKNGSYANVAGELGLAVPVPTRGLATGDANGDGLLDLAVARQWDAPVFYQNQSKAGNSAITLQLTHETATGATGSPAIGAEAMVKVDGRTIVGRVDGGSGHSGRRSHEVHLGLGKNVTGPVTVMICWRDRTGQVREQQLQLTPGRHAIQLGSQAKEK